TAMVRPPASQARLHRPGTATSRCYGVAPLRTKRRTPAAVALARGPRRAAHDLGAAALFSAEWSAAASIGTPATSASPEAAWTRLSVPALASPTASTARVVSTNTVNASTSGLGATCEARVAG